MKQKFLTACAIAGALWAMAPVVSRKRYRKALHDNKIWCAIFEFETRMNREHESALRAELAWCENQLLEMEKSVQFGDKCMIPRIALGACLYDFVQCFFRIKTEQEADGIWVAEVIDEPGVLAYGATEQLAVEAVYAVLAKAKETK